MSLLQEASLIVSNRIDSSLAGLEDKVYSRDIFGKLESDPIT